MSYFRRRALTQFYILIAVPIFLCQSSYVLSYQQPRINVPEEAIRPHYSLDPRQTFGLALVEEDLSKSLSPLPIQNTTIGKNDLCFMYLSKYIKSFTEDTKAVKNATGNIRALRVTENPLLVFRMVRRIVRGLGEVQFHCSNHRSDLVGRIKETFKKANLTAPTVDDFTDALMGLLRIQYVYGLNATSEIRHGILHGASTNVSLDFDDCLALGKWSIIVEAYLLAYQWLRAAELSLSKTNGTFAKWSDDQVDLKATWKILLNATDASNMENLLAKLENRKQERFKNAGLAHYQAYATCRGQMTMSLEYRNSLFCFYIFHRDPYFYINPLKAEVLSINPDIIQIYEFVNNGTIKFMRNITQNFMIRSATFQHNTIQRFYSSRRTSMSSSIRNEGNDSSHPKMVALNRLTEKVTGLHVMKQGASENIGVLMYGSLGGHFDLHEDPLQRSKHPIHEDGDRVVTVLMFLTDVKHGGYTAFPAAGTFAKPIRGSAVVWNNLKLNGEQIREMIHCGCPVILGRKEVANRWILQYENMWKRPCSLDKNA